MKILTAAFGSLLMFTAIGWCQTDLYTDANGPTPLINGWAVGDTVTEISTGAYEGTTCLDAKISATNWWAGGGFAYTNQWQIMDFSMNTTFSFACKAVNAYSVATYDLFPVFTDTSVHVTKFVFSPTSDWQVFTVPISTWVADLTTITMINYEFHGSQAVMSGDVYFDDIQLDATGSSVKHKQIALPRADNRLVFQKDGEARVAIFAMNGGHALSFTKHVSANTPYALADFARADLHAGAYLMRVTGAGVDIFQKLIK